MVDKLHLTILLALAKRRALAVKANGDYNGDSRECRLSLNLLDAISQGDKKRQYDLSYRLMSITLQG